MQKPITISIAVALALHGLLLLTLVATIRLDIPFSKPTTIKTEKEEQPEVTVILRPKLPAVKPLVEPEPLPSDEPRLDAPPKKVAEKPKETPKPKQPTPQPSIAIKPKPTQPDSAKPLPPQKRKFARTSADQAGTPDAPTDILGERDTLAASELAPTALDKPNTPTQDGVNPLRPGHVETVNSTHQDGSLGLDKTGGITEIAQEATISKDSNVIDETPKLETPKPDEGSLTKPKNDYLKEGRLLPKSSTEKEKATAEEKKKEEDSIKEKPDKGSKTDGQNGEIKQTTKRDSFSGHSRKTKVTGSISRRGKSALNVKNSPLGRYQALVGKTVELQWRRKCVEQRDHIVPGVISVRFYVDAKGDISGIKFQEVIGATYIMTGFTQRAIRNSELPKMPKSVIKELKGESLELIYNFYF